jgi:predicted dehydrogenase
MVEYLKLLSEKKIQVSQLISAKYDIDKAKQAYESLKEGTSKPLMILLNYPKNLEKKSTKLNLQPDSIPYAGNKIKIAIIGAGGFIRATHLPNILALKRDYILQAVVNRTGHLAKSVGEQFGAKYATTDYQVVLKDPEIDAIIIGTRHDLHAKIIIESLKAGKHVLVEKPMVISEEELEEIRFFIESQSGKSIPVLLTGYNRRFSPYAKKAAELLIDKSGPFIIDYRINAGYILPNHWVHGKEGGGRNIGEACHIYDLFTYLTNSKVTKITANSITPASSYYQKNDNFITTLKFEDGSLATLTYNAMGAKNFDKETAEIFFDGKVVSIKDYKQLEIFGLNSEGFKSSNQDKGHLDELKSFAEAIKTGIWSIPWWQQYQTAKISLEVEKQIFEK